MNTKQKVLFVVWMMAATVMFLLALESFAGEVTYTKDVKPIFQKRCESCHGVNWSDKNWMDYDTAFKFKDKIKKRTENNTMPPGNNTAMTTEERLVVIQWVDDGGKK